MLLSFFKNLALYMFFAYLLSSYTDKSNTTVMILSAVIIIVMVLVNTLCKVSLHEKQYNKIYNLSKLIDNRASKFAENGSHLNSFYNLLLYRLHAKLKPKEIYLGDNKTFFARPYLFIDDTNRIVKRIINDFEYLNHIDNKVLDNYEGSLYNNGIIDTLYKTRLEFFIKNINQVDVRDRLINKYRQKFPNAQFLEDIKTSNEVKLLTQRENYINSIPDHINIDFFKKSDELSEINEKDTKKYSTYWEDYKDN